MRINDHIDSGFILHAARNVINSLENPEYSVSQLSADLVLSREQVHRKLKKNTGLSTGRFIRFLRLIAAHKYLYEGKLSIAQISYKVGFENPGYFNKCFREEFGQSPGKLRRNPYDLRKMSNEMKSFYAIAEIRSLLKDFGVVFPDRKPLTQSTTIWLPSAIITLILLVSAVGILSNRMKDSPHPVNLTDIGRIGILPFKNLTADSIYDQVGEISSSWLSGKMDQLEKIRTVPYFTIKQYEGYAGVLPSDPEGRPTFRDVTGAKYMLTGSYYNNNSTFTFDSRLVDAHTQETVYHLPVVSGSADSIMYLVEELRLELAGLLLNLDKVKLGKIDPPGYEAYSNYLKGLHELRNGVYPSAAYDYFCKAATLEPDFVMAQIFVSWFIPVEQRDSLLNYIDQIPKTEYERKVFLELYYTYQRDYLRAMSTTLENLEENPLDYYLNMEAAHLARAQFFPELSLDILSRLENPMGDDFGKVWYYFKIWNYTESLAMLGEYDSILKYIKSIPEEYHSPATPLIMMHAMVSLGKKREPVEELILRFSAKQDSLLAENYCAAAYEFALAGDTTNAHYFAGKAIPLMKRLKYNKALLFDLVDSYYLNGNVSEARNHITSILSEDPDNTEFRIYLAQTEAAMGNKAKALDAVKGLLDKDTVVFWRRQEYEHDSNYLLARIYALLGEKDKAISLLGSAMKNGQLCHSWDYDRDIFLLPLFDVPAFRQMTRPRDYRDDIKLP